MKLSIGYTCIFLFCLVIELTNLGAIQLPEGSEDTEARQYSQSKSITASGEQYNENWLSCSHPTMPFGTVLRIQNQRTGRSIDAKVNDRQSDSVKGIQLSKIAAEMLGISNQQSIPVTITPIGLTTAQLLPAKKEIQKEAIMVAFDPSAFDENNRDQAPFQSSPIPVSLADTKALSEFPPLFANNSTAVPTSSINQNKALGSEHQRVTFSSELPMGNASNNDVLALSKPITPVENLAPLRAHFGAFSNPVEAIQMMNELNDQGFDTTILSQQQQHYVVTKGIFSSQDRALQWIENVQRMHHRELAPIRL